MSDPLIELLVEEQRRQGEQIGELQSEMRTGFAQMREHLTDYPAVKAQVFDWRASLRLTGKVAGWIAGIIATVATVVQLFT